MAFGNQFNFGFGSGDSFFSTRKDAPSREADKFFRAKIDDLNGSGVEGEVLAFFDDDTDKLTLIVTADGLEENQVHLMHVHGFTDGRDAVIPDLRDDTDRDGYIELLEGVPDYGGILLNVKLNHADGSGGDNGHSHEGGFAGFPLAPDGEIRFMETYQLPADMLDADADLQNYHFVIHGMSTPASAGVGTGGEVNGTAGYKLVLPVAIGDFEEITRGQAFRELAQAKGDALREDIQDRADVFVSKLTSHLNSSFDSFF
jgi:hypothetical protein